jgi:hypothetical protein
MKVFSIQRIPVTFELGQYTHLLFPFTKFVVTVLPSMLPDAPVARVSWMAVTELFEMFAQITVFASGDHELFV